MSQGVPQVTYEKSAGEKKVVSGLGGKRKINLILKSYSCGLHEMQK